MYFSLWFTRKKHIKYFICFECYQKKYKDELGLEITHNHIIVQFKEKIPRNSRPFIMVSPSFKITKSTTEAVNLESDKTIDNTKYSGREPIFNAIDSSKGKNIQIGKPIEELIKKDIENNKELESNPIKYLQQQKPSKDIVKKK